MEKFYNVYVWSSPSGKPVLVQHYVKDMAAAERVAKKAAVDYREDAFILTATHLVQAPQPEATVTALT